MTKDELVESLEAFKQAVSDFAKKTISSRIDEDGDEIPEGNPARVTVEGEESKVGHIMSALERYIEPVLAELEGNDD